MSENKKQRKKSFLEPFLTTVLHKENCEYYYRFKHIIGNADEKIVDGQKTINVPHLYFWSVWGFYPWYSMHNVIVCKMRLCHKYLPHAIKTGNVELAEKLTTTLVSLAKKDMKTHTFSRFVNGKEQRFFMKNYFDC